MDTSVVCPSFQRIHGTKAATTRASGAKRSTHLALFSVISAQHGADRSQRGDGSIALQEKEENKFQRREENHKTRNEDIVRFALLKCQSRMPTGSWGGIVSTLAQWLSFSWAERLFSEHRSSTLDGN